MLAERRIQIGLRIASIVGLVLCIAMAGWFVGRMLPIFRPTSSDRPTKDGAGDPVEAEAPLDEQIAAVQRGASGTIQIEGRPIGRQELERLARLERLQVLKLDHEDNAIGDEDCKLLAGLRNLAHLRIRGGSIGDDGLVHLATLPQLKILNLPRSRVTDHGLATLSHLPRLSQLRLGSGQITDAGLKELHRFAALTQLHLIGAPLSDAGLDEIARLKRLESLYLDDSRVTDQGLERLFRARPDLHVHVNQQHHDRDPQRGHK